MNEVVALLEFLRASPVGDEVPEPEPLADRCLFAAASEPVLILSASSGVIVDANPAAAARLRTTRSALIGEPVLEAFDAASGRTLARALARIRIENSPRTILAGTRDGGAELRLHLSLTRTARHAYTLIRLGDGSASPGAHPADGVASTVLDLIGEMADGFAVTDLGLRVRYANRAFAQLAGLSMPEALIGHSLTRWLELSQADLAGLEAQRGRREAVRELHSTVRGTTTGARGPTTGALRPVDIWAVSVPEGEHACWGFRVRPIDG